MQLPRPQTMEKVGRNLSLIALIVMLVVLPSERGVATTYLGAQVLVLLGFILRLVGQVRWRFWAVAVAVSLISMGVLAGIAEISVGITESPFTLGEIVKELLVQGAVLYFCMTLIFLSQFVYRPEVWAFHDRWMKAILALVWGYFLVVLISAVCSTNPVESLRYIRKFLAPYVLMYMIVVETLYSWRHYRLIITTIFLVGIVVTSISVMGRYFYIYGSYNVRREFLEMEFLRDEETEYPANTLPDGTVQMLPRREIRNQWPFEHHNRLCAYALMITLFVWLQFFVTHNWELRTLVAISTLVPFWCMMVTMTRGGWIALGVGAVGLVLMLNWRSIWVLLVVALATWWLSPPVMRERIRTMFDPRTYFSSMGTFKDRRDTWIWSIDIVRKHPWLGLGAGWEVFESYVKVHYGALREGVEPPHAHNNFLQIAAESGVFAVLLFLAFMGGLTAQTFRAWRNTKPQTKRRCVVAGFFGLLIAITVFGMSNYSLRYNNGMLIWVCFGLMTLLPSIARAISEPAETSTSTPPKPTPV